ncbi:hypothetical protein ABK040_012597 [Willaertia magna]
MTTFTNKKDDSTIPSNYTVNNSVNNAVSNNATTFFNQLQQSKIYNYQYTLFLILSVASIHVLEEMMQDWKTWAISTLQLSHLTWQGFYMTNFTMYIYMIGCAGIGWQAPWFSLSSASLIIINAIFFHVLPTLTTSIYSPGTTSAVLLYLPVGLFTYYGAFKDRVLNVGNLIISFILGGLLMAMAVYLQKNAPSTLKFD